MQKPDVPKKMTKNWFPFFGHFFPSAFSVEKNLQQQWIALRCNQI